MSGRAYQLLHSDAFTAELEALGLDSSLFGAAGVPAPIFQALVPRRAGVFDGNANTFGTGDEPSTFTRASDGIYRDADGKYRIAAAGAIRAEYSAAGAFLGYLFEPAITNKCTCESNPDSGLTGYTKGGDAAAVMARVDDATLLASAGLDEIGNGYAVELDNSAGVAAAYITVSGTTGNTNTHTVSAWVRKTGGAGQADIRLSNGAAATAFTNSAAYARVDGTGTPAGASQLRLQCAAGVTARFYFPQLEELTVVTSPIITTGSSASRSADVLSIATPSNFSDAETLGILDFSPLWDGSDLPLDTRHNLMSFFDVPLPGTGANRWWYIQRTAAGEERILHLRGAGGAAYVVVASFNKLQEYRTMVRANGNNIYVGYWNGSAWTWGTSSTANTRSDDGTMRYCNAVSMPILIKRLALWNRYLTEAECELLFTPA